jgi:hypothetical protein
VHQSPASRLVPLGTLISVPVFLAAFFLALPIACAWQSTLAPDAPGPFPAIRPFQAEYRLGWAEIEAAKARAAISYDGGHTLFAGSGGTTGFARTLYQLDATLNAAAASSSLETIRSEQLEKYATRTLSTRIEGKSGNLTSLREWISPGSKPGRWKPVKISPVRDLFAASLFIRSQSLAKGEKVRTLVFPGGSPFLVDIESLGPDKISIAGSLRDALRLDIKIQSVNTKKGNALEPHRKFRSGTLWLSNDADRTLLRAEVQVFVGYVFAELSSFAPSGGVFESR